MCIPSLRAQVGWSLLVLALPQTAQAIPPTIDAPPSPFRSYPTKEDLRTYLEPASLIAIPDDPPPHEGSMFDLPYVIEPPDLLQIEVLEALPGRPLSGERLVRPDGTISLGFYGDIHVRGLTEEQAKVKILLHLRKHINDDQLGLLKYLGSVAGPTPDELEGADDSGSNEVHPGPGSGGVRAIEDATDQGPTAKPTTKRKRARKRSRRGETRVPATDRPVPEYTPQGANVSAPRERDAASDSPVPSEPIEPPPSEFGPVMTVHPADSDRLFLDVTTYNSKNYYVLGDVASPGRMPFTGHETVLDALIHASGFLSTANSRDIRLIRPARAGKPVRIYKVDYEAITEKGDTTTNYQVFPGDRIVVGRNDVVKKTIELDRLAAPLQTIFNSLLQYAFMVESLKTFGDPAAGKRGPGTGTGHSTLPEPQRVAVVKVWAEFWAKALAEKGGVTFDETRLREALLRALEPSAKDAEDARPR